MRTINMLSKADMVKGQGVLSAHDEQVALAKKVMAGGARVLENKKIAEGITHYHSINPEFYLSISKAKAQGAAVGYVHFLPETVENSISLPRFAKNLFYKYMISFYKRMDYLVTVNPVFIEKLAAYGIGADKVTYIPNVVSEECFYPLPKEKREAVRRKYRIPEERFTVLCVGQLQKRKGVFDFVEIAKRMPECQFVWAGGFSFGKLSEGYEEIRGMMKHLPANVKFLGIVDRKKMNEIYNMADMMFLPSYEELFPMTILESMNCALPVLVRDLPIYDPILFDHALRGRHKGEFISVIRQLKDDPVFYQQSAHASYEGHLRYSRETVGAMWKQFYERVFLKEEEKKRQKASGKWNRRARKDAYIWTNKRQQYI